MIKSFVKGIPFSVKGYFRESWGASFILGFMVLLMSAAASLVICLEYLANELSIYASYALVVGVVLQLACFLKYKKRNSGKV